jgi:hypothetical protein
MPLKLAWPPPPVNIGFGGCVAVGIVEFPVEAMVLGPVPDGGADVMVVIPEHIVLNVAAVETLIKLVLVVDAEVEVDDVTGEVEGLDDVEGEVEEMDDVKDEVEDMELDDETDGPVQKPLTHPLKAHCESISHGA